MKHPQSTKQLTPQTKRSGITRRGLLVLLAGGAGSIAWGAREGAFAVERAAVPGTKVTLYKDPQCGCCEGYANYLRGAGFEVAIVPTHDLEVMDEKYGIPESLQPCHISLMDGYVVGGHVPVPVVNRLLTERPKITGIMLPGMPEGSPGMTGTKHAPFQIYEIAAGPPRIYATV
jgi:hypothetical protein